MKSSLNFEEMVRYKAHLGFPKKPKPKKKPVDKKLLLAKKKEKKRVFAKKVKAEQIRKDNPNERIFRHLLIEYGIKHVWQKTFYCEKRCVCVDFYLPKHNIVIEIDGFSHLRTISKDKERTMYIKIKHRVSAVIRITNGQIANNLDQVRDLVLEKFS